MLNPRLYATRGLYPGLRTTFSVATRGFIFDLREYGIRLMSYITAIFSTDSDLKTPIQLESKIK